MSKKIAATRRDGKGRPAHISREQWAARAAFRRAWTQGNQLTRVLARVNRAWRKALHRCVDLGLTEL